MKKYIGNILTSILALMVGCLAGFGIVRYFITLNSFWLVLVMPGVLFTVYNTCCICKTTRRIKKIEKEFKDKYGFNIRDKDALERYLKGLEVK